MNYAYYNDSVNPIYLESKYLDLRGNPIKCTPKSHPYSFDTFVVHKSDNFDMTDYAVYSDRMMQWDYEKFSKCAQKVWNDQRQLFDSSTPEELEKFLQLYFNSKTVVLTAILKGCNQATGYPYWVFMYKGDTTDDEE